MDSCFRGPPNWTPLSPINNNSNNNNNNDDDDHGNGNNNDDDNDDDDDENEDNDNVNGNEHFKGTHQKIFSPMLNIIFITCNANMHSFIL